MVIKSKLWRFVALLSLCGLVSACGRGQEFSFAANESAQQTNTYPHFTQPQAATAQFTDEEREKLTTQLDRDKRRLKSLPGVAAAKAESPVDAKEDARREAEKTLQEIEKSGNR